MIGECPPPGPRWADRASTYYAIFAGQAYSHRARRVIVNLGKHSPGSRRMDLGTRIKTIRLGMGLDQAHFGAMLGASQSAVARWENGSSPRAAALRQIAALATISVEDLLGDDRVRNPVKAHIPVIGYFDGVRIVPHDRHFSQSLETDLYPAATDGTTIAIEIRDDSLMPIVNPGAFLICEPTPVAGLTKIRKSLYLIKLSNEDHIFGRLHKNADNSFSAISTKSAFHDKIHIEWLAEVRAIVIG